MFVMFYEFHFVSKLVCIRIRENFLINIINQLVSVLDCDQFIDEADMSGRHC